MRKVMYFFSKFKDEDIDWIVGAGVKEIVRPGEILIKEGQEVEKLYVTISGRFDVTSRDVHIASIGSGEVVGELSFLDSRAPNVSVTASENSVVLALGITRVRSKLRVDTGFASRFYHALGILLANRMRQTTSTLALGDERNLDDNVEVYSELTTETLDDAALAATRFDKIRKMILEQ